MCALLFSLLDTTFIINYYYSTGLPWENSGWQDNTIRVSFGVQVDKASTYVFVPIFTFYCII